jgi:beta-phosphoglucomutase-like phosphatase (HAD superfamily)
VQNAGLFPDFLRKAFSLPRQARDKHEKSEQTAWFPQELCPHERIVVAADLPAGRGKPQPDIFLEAAKKIGVINAFFAPSSS